MKCPECQARNAEHTLVKDKTSMYNIDSQERKREVYYICSSCQNQYINHNNELKRLPLFRYRIGMGSILFDEPLNIVREKIKELKCCHSGELIGNLNYNILIHDDKLYIIKHSYYNKITRCNNCNIYSFIRPCNKVFKEGRNTKHFCDVCAEHFSPKFFGYTFKKLKGRTTNINPFDRFVGIELETVRGKHIKYFSIPDSIRDSFASTYDGSLFESNNYGEEDDDDSPVNDADYCQDDDRGNRGVGREFVTIPLGRDKLFVTIDELTQLLRQHNCTINKSCGFHVHFDMTNESIRDVRKTFLLFSILEDTLFDMLPNSRRNNHYCLPLKKNYKEFFGNSFDAYWYGTNDSYSLDSQKRSKYNNTRYSAINYHALFFHGTLENRMHSGTINPKKIKNWILINHMIIEYAKSRSMKQLLRLSGNQQLLFNIIKYFEDKYPVLKAYNLVDYIRNRTNKFAVDTGKPLKVIRNLKPNIVENTLAEESFRDFMAYSNGEEQVINGGNNSSLNYNDIRNTRLNYNAYTYWLNDND